MDRFESIPFNEQTRSFEEEGTSMGRGRKALVKVEIPESDAAILSEWKQVSDWLSQAKQREQALRMALVAKHFSMDKLEGSETVDIGFGWRLKATKNLNYTATNETHQTEHLLNAVGAVDPGIAQGLIRWKPELSTATYRALLELIKAHPQLQALAAAAITVKPGMPELELIAPKDTVEPSV